MSNSTESEPAVLVEKSPGNGSDNYVIRIDGMGRYALSPGDLHAAFGADVRPVACMECHDKALVETERVARRRRRSEILMRAGAPTLEERLCALEERLDRVERDRTGAQLIQHVVSGT